MEKFIVECRLPSGKVFKRSKPMSEADAKEQARELKDMKTFSAHVVPAEKYAPKFNGVTADKPEETGPNQYRSRVE